MFLYLHMQTKVFIYLDFPIKELEEEVVLHPSSQQQQSTASAGLDLQRQLEVGHILDGVQDTEAVAKVRFWKERKIGKN